jgi:hypothetical protein
MLSVMIIPKIDFSLFVVFEAGNQNDMWQRVVDERSRGIWAAGFCTL